jgi:hypothetical protein
MSEIVAPIKIYFNLFGILLIIMGWAIDNIKSMPFITHIFFRSYHKAAQGLKRLESLKVLHPTDKGFQEVSGVVKEYMAEPFKNQQINRLEYLEASNAVTFLGSTAKMGKLVTLKATLSDSTSGTVKVQNLEDALQEKYYEDKKKPASTILFWTGVLIQFVLAFI